MKWIHWNKQSDRTGLLLGAVLTVALAHGVRAQGPVLPMLIATPEAITDEFGVNLEGDPYDEIADRVEILRVTGAGVTPPNLDGTPGPGTEIIDQGVSQIGNLVAPDLLDAGMFAVAIATNQPLPPTKLFVRVFNAATGNASTFYGDSPVFTVQATENVYLVTIGSTDQPLDPGDDDWDGLNNSWEESYGSYRHIADSDGDGVGDLEEHLAGTDLMDASRYLHIEDEAPVSLTDMAITWQSVSGRCYQVEYTDDLVENPDFLPIGSPVQASTDYHTYIDVDALLHAPRFYRVRVFGPETTCGE